jgi:hypothetical protein
MTDSNENDDAKEPIYAPPMSAIVRAKGETLSEQYLAKLADKSFLNLWSYPNVFIDKKQGVGDGKELCDLLVVCGDHVLIFSDKTIAWPANDVDLAWRRWFRRAVAHSVDQIRGAERWIKQFPDRIFLDKKCTQKLPITLPPPDRRVVHGIAVALGAGEACKQHFGDGIGSLIVTPDIKGRAHYEGDVLPFAVGDVNPDGVFVHVLDDATLNIVLGELDTIVDLTAYLTKKERLIRSGKLVASTGEEELVAYYMTHMNPQEEHDFTNPDGSNLRDNQFFSLASGHYQRLLDHPQYKAKKAADQISYLWDDLIGAFTFHILGGTSLVPVGQEASFENLELGVRYMAQTPRFIRRTLGQSVAEVLEKAHLTDRFTRSMLLEGNRDTAFFFMTVAIPTFVKAYEKYRAVRRNMLKVYGLSLLQKFPHLSRVVGIATEPPQSMGPGGSSEDLVLVEQPGWTDAMLAELEDQKKSYNMFQDGNFKQHAIKGTEFPTVNGPPAGKEHSSKDFSGMTRRERRRRSSEKRRQKQDRTTK